MGPGICPICSTFFRPLKISARGQARFCFSNFSMFAYSRKMSFFRQLLQSLSNAGLLCAGIQLGVFQNLQGLSFVGLSFVLAQNLAIFCIDYFVISFSVRDKGFGWVFFYFLFSHVFCSIISIDFFSTKIFSFISFSRSFVSVIAVTNFEMSYFWLIFLQLNILFQFLLSPPETFWWCFVFRLSRP